MQRMLHPTVSVLLHVCSTGLHVGCSMLSEAPLVSSAAHESWTQQIKGCSLARGDGGVVV
jgi:hypothetical protein